MKIIPDSYHDMRIPLDPKCFEYEKVDPDMIE